MSVQPCFSRQVLLRDRQSWGGVVSVEMRTNFGPAFLNSTQPARAVLSDGSIAAIRPLCPEDFGELKRLHDSLPERDRYFRFFGTPSETSLDRLLRHLVTVGDAHVLTLGMFVGEGLIGVAHFEVRGGSETAEVAFVVEHARHARGVATLLLEHLVAAARQLGVRAFMAEVLAENSAMLQVFTHSGLRCDAHLDSGTYLVKLDLDVDSQYLSAVSDRERVADVASLRHVLCPDSVAVIGASRHSATVGNAVLCNILDGGYTGAVYAINKHGGEIHGRPAFLHVRDLPESPELAVLCVRADAVADVAEECGHAGARALIVMTAGITGDSSVADRLIAVVRRWGMRLLGPNCLGIANSDPAVRLDATFSKAGLPEGNVGAVTQSGGVGIAVLDRLADLGLGISTLVSTGDKYDVSGNDMVLWWERDARTQVGVLYLESFGNPRKFAWLARRFSRTKPLIMLRSGASPVAQQAAVSHTAATATPSTSREALLRQTGVIGVDNLDELFAVLAVLGWQPRPAGSRVAVVTNAGGLGVLTADACTATGLEFANLDDAHADLAALLPSQANTDNPIDTTATIDDDTFARSLEIVLNDPAVDSVVVPLVRTAITDPAAILAGTVAREKANGCVKPVLAVRAGQRESVTSLVSGDTRVPVFADPGQAARALADVTAYQRWLVRPPGVVPDLTDFDILAARRLVAEVLHDSPTGGWLEPDTVGKLLGATGLPVVPMTVCTTESEALDAFRELGGSVALKARVKGLLHKARAGGVVLGVSTVGELRAAWSRLHSRFGSGFSGVVMQPMADPGQEFLVGVINELAFGPLIVFGLGGTDTDLIADRSHRLVPLTDRDAADMLGDLRASARLFGAAADRPLDDDRLIEVLLRTSRLVELLPELAEVDLNPVVVREHGVEIPDARIRLEPRQPVDPLVRKLRM